MDMIHLFKHINLMSCLINPGAMDPCIHSQHIVYVVKMDLGPVSI